MKYRKKPVEIEAIKYKKEHIDRALDFCNKLRYNPHDNEYYVDTLEGCMKVTEGDFRVPQNRERVYITGYLREGSGREIFPLKRTSRKDYRNEYTTTIVPTRYRGSGGETYIKSEPKILKIGGGNSQGSRVYSSKGLSCTLSANGGGQGAKTGLYAIPILTPDRVNKRQNGRRYKTDGEPMFTLTAQDRHGVIIGNNRRYFRIRRLTPKECWRLQGFSDLAFEKAKEAGTSDAQLYKQAGNAVTVNVIQAIGQELKEMEREVEE